MQRAWIKTLLTLMLLLSFAVPTWVHHSASAQTGAYLTANQTVWVYAGPGNGFWILGSLYGGESVPVMGISPDGAWYYVNAAFGEGWVSNVGVVATGAAAVGVMDPGPIGISTGALNVRYGAGINAQSLGILARGKQVYVLAQNADGSWYQIRWEYGTGWVTAAYITLSGVAPATDANTYFGDGQGGGVPLTGDAPYVVVLATYLNIRTGPGINYAILGAARSGETLPVIGRTADNSWYQVTTASGEGWVYSGFVATRNEYGASPVTTGEAEAAAVAGPFGIVNTG
ncbi:MAG: SH3 domain-containing protein, partial [Anaerolineae bacterium]|nr:SH3 domain-containing protein [Anaerolineae bacterium]